MQPWELSEFADGLSYVIDSRNKYMEENAKLLERVKTLEEQLTQTEEARRILSERQYVYLIIINLFRLGQDTLAEQYVQQLKE